MRARVERVMVYLKDGRTVDITGLSAAEAVRLLWEMGVARDGIRRTVHIISTGAWRPNLEAE